jgi:hypothetical protein
MLWTKELADFITLVAFEDDETELAKEILKTMIIINARINELL